MGFKVGDLVQPIDTPVLRGRIVHLDQFTALIEVEFQPEPLTIAIRRLEHVLE